MCIIRALSSEDSAGGSFLQSFPKALAGFPHSAPVCLVITDSGKMLHGCFFILHLNPCFKYSDSRFNQLPYFLLELFVSPKNMNIHIRVDSCWINFCQSDKFFMSSVWHLMTEDDDDDQNCLTRKSPVSLFDIIHLALLIGYKGKCELSRAALQCSVVQAQCAV